MAVSGTKVNGDVYDFASIELSINNATITNFTEINYDSALDIGMRHNNRGKITGSTRGVEEHNADVSLPKEDAQAVIDALGNASGGKGFGRVYFDIVCKYANGTDPVITDTLTGVKVKGIEASNSAGNEQTVVKLSLFVSDIDYNGQKMTEG